MSPSVGVFGNRQQLRMTSAAQASHLQLLKKKKKRSFTQTWLVPFFGLGANYGD